MFRRLTAAALLAVALFPLPTVGATPADRSGMFCVDVRALSSRILSAEDSFDAVARARSAARHLMFNELDKTYAALLPLLMDRNGQYGPTDLFAPDHQLKRCDDDTQWALARAIARYNVASLDYTRPTDFGLDTGEYRYTPALRAVCDQANRCEA